MGTRKSATTRSERNTTAVIYARVSSKEQEREGFSIPAQQKLLQDYATLNGLNIASEFVDIETAKQAGRTGFGRMMSFLRQHPSCRIVLVEKTDRLYRNLRDYVTLDELDLEIHLVKEGVVLSQGSRSSEKFMHGIKVLMAKNYIDNLSEETRKGMLEKARQGIWPSFAPLGYRNIEGPNNKRVIEPDPDTAPIVARLFERYGTGQYSLKDVTCWAKDEGLVFRKSKVQVPKGTVHQMLRNRIYTGDFSWDGTNYRGSHTALVSHELWSRVQAVLDGRSARSGRRVKHDFVFSRMLSCGHCGCMLVGEIKKARYVYYHCTGNRGPCTKPYVREEDVADAFGKVLETIRVDSEVLSWLTRALQSSFSDVAEYHSATTARLRTNHDRLQSRLEAMYVDKLDGKITEGFYEAKVLEWRAEQDQIERQLAAHKAADRNYLDQGVQLLELAAKAPFLYERQAAPQKRRLLDFLCSNSRWTEDGLQVELRKPFDVIAVAAEAHTREKAAGVASNGLSANWLLGQDSNLRPSG